MKNILIVFAAIAVIFCVYWFFLKPDNLASYEDEITLYRHQRAEFYRSSPESPFVVQKVNFSYLDYFPVDASFKIKAEYTTSQSLQKLALATSTGTYDTLLVAGTASFTWNNQKQTLLVLGTSNSDDNLFIPFQDATTGNSTYGAGRYLEVSRPDSKYIILDFNKCYNPYCAYTEGYTCPFPPKENRLGIAIEAGEKTYPGH